MWMPTVLSWIVPGVVSVSAWKRSPPWIAFAALPSVPGAENVQFSARLGATPTPLKPLASPVRAPGVPRTAVPAACAAVSGEETAMPVPGAITGAPLACAAVSAGENVTPVPRSCTAAPDACGAASGAVSVTPVPVAPAVPTAWIVPASPSTTIGSPAAIPVTLATLTFVAPAAVAADNVVLRPWVPTLEIVTVSPSTRRASPAASPVVAATLTFVAPAGAGANRVVERAWVPTAVIVAVSEPIRSVSPATKLLTAPTLRLVSPAAAGRVSVGLPAEYRNRRVSPHGARRGTGGPRAGG